MGGSGGDYDGTQCESLEDRIYNTMRPPGDEETRTSIRLEQWQLAHVDMLTSEINTSRAEVLAKAYVHGLAPVRKVIMEHDLDSLVVLRKNLQRLTLEGDYRNESIAKIQGELMDYKVEMETQPQGDLVGPQPVPVPKSILSEVDNKYVGNLNLPGGFHRIILSAGLNDSEYKTNMCSRCTDMMFESLVEGVRSARTFLERMASDYVSIMSHKWITQGISDRELEAAHEVAGAMKTSRLESVTYHLDAVTTSETNNKGDQI